MIRLLFPLIHAADRTGIPEIDNILFNKNAETAYAALFKTQSGHSYPVSKQYKWKDFVKAFVQMYKEGIAGLVFHLGDPADDKNDATRVLIAKINMAAFFGQCMHETIQYDACDENNWTDQHRYDKWGKSKPFATDAACGQAKNVYANYKCSGEYGDIKMECPKLGKGHKVMYAVTHATWPGSPPPMYCAPDSKVPADKKFGYIDYDNPCSSSGGFDATIPPYERGECDLYEGQKKGKMVWSSTPLSGHTTTEGCCWWGRGVIQTTGRCNFGVLNYYLGTNSQGVKDSNLTYKRKNAKFSTVDFCKDPEFICNGDKPELKWIAGLFYWVQSVQKYGGDSKGTWNFFEEVKKVAEKGADGAKNDRVFIDAISSIVNRGCHYNPCPGPNGPTLKVPERAEFFKVALGLFLADTPAVTGLPDDDGKPGEGGDDLTPGKSNTSGGNGGEGDGDTGVSGGGGQTTQTPGGGQTTQTTQTPGGSQTTQTPTQTPGEGQTTQTGEGQATQAGEGQATQSQATQTGGNQTTGEGQASPAGGGQLKQQDIQSGSDWLSTTEIVIVGVVALVIVLCVGFLCIYTSGSSRGAKADISKTASKLESIATMSQKPPSRLSQKPPSRLSQKPPSRLSQKPPSRLSQKLLTQPKSKKYQEMLRINGQLTTSKKQKSTSAKNQRGKGNQSQRKSERSSSTKDRRQRNQ